MNRLFLDANVLFSAAYRENAGLLQLWRLQQVELCSSHYAVAEARVNLSEAEQRERLEKLTRSLHFFEGGDAKLPREIDLPEKDVPVMLAAINGRATHLLTGDFRHFGRYFGKKIGGVLVVPPAAYLASSRIR
jgi:predicted nucleic acid-binding protein